MIESRLCSIVRRFKPGMESAMHVIRIIMILEVNKDYSA